jgi:hypothetical protein
MFIGASDDSVFIGKSGQDPTIYLNSTENGSAGWGNQQFRRGGGWSSLHN